MSKYDKLDDLIVRAIAGGDTALWRICTGPVREECNHLERTTGRSDWTTLAWRLQVLRKRGAIEFTPRTGWVVKRNEK